MKQCFAYVLALLLLLGCLAGCGSAAPEETLPPETPEPTFLSVDGYEIERALFEDVLALDIGELTAYYGITDPSLELREGFTVADWVREMAGRELTEMALRYVVAGELGLALTEEDLAAIDAEIDTYAQIYAGGDRAALFEQYGGSERYYRFQYGALALEKKILVHEYGEDGADLSDEEAVAFLTDNDYLYAKHILFKAVDDSRQPLDEATVAEKQAQAEAVLAQLQAADPSVLPGLFDALMHELSEDPGLAYYPDGYFFQAERMVPEFSEAAQALEEGGLSGVVQSESTGFHILYRPAVDPDAVFEVDTSGNPVTLRAAAANGLLDAMFAERLASAEVLRSEEYEALDVAALFPAPETGTETE